MSRRPRSRPLRPSPSLALPLALAGLATAAPLPGQEDDPALRVEIVRTEYGVPHVLARDLEAAGFGLGWVQMEDYGERVVRGLIAARGESALHLGEEEVDDDVGARLDHRRAVAGFPTLAPDAQAVYRGFAEGVNRWIESHPDAFGRDVFPGGVPRFHAHDVLARDVVGAGTPGAFLRRLEDRGADGVLVGGDRGWAVTPDTLAGAPPDEEHAENAPEGGGGPWSDAYRPDPGSNAWALAPSRTTSGNAILVRNPHLAWDAGYYEAHVTVPGVLDFYGDFRVGGPFGIIGGFNPRLGWATTNNDPDGEEVYALGVDPADESRVRLDGRWVPVVADTIVVEVRQDDGTVGSESRIRERTLLGPVIARRDGWVFVLKAALDGEVRLGQQFLRMMTARDLGEWMDAMRIHARVASNFTYADADGNILYVWNAGTPALPHPPTGDTLAVIVERTADAWSRLVPWDGLPRVVNPPGGYLHNENDPFHYANLHQVLDASRWPANFPAPDLRLRSQHSLSLIGGDDRLSLEEVVRRKASYRMLLAERVKDDLVAALAGATGPAAEARELLSSWDGRVAPESRGAVLFATWWDLYDDAVGDGEPFAEPWTPDRPTDTPRGLARPGLAARLVRAAADSVRTRWGSADVPWGDVHRARVGEVDVPVGGCHGNYGCFRVLWFTDDEDGLRRVRGGDGWVLAVEFGPRPRARSVLAYGMTPDAEAPHCCDQVEMFARGETKAVLFEWPDIEARAERRYRPGRR